jgi:hypothetical protein
LKKIIFHLDIYGRWTAYLSQADKKLAELGGSYNSIEAARLDATRMWNVQEYMIFTRIFE